MFKRNKSNSEVFMPRPGSPELGPLMKEKVGGKDLILRKVWNDDMTGPETNINKVQDRLEVYRNFLPLDGILPEVIIIDRDVPLVGTPHIKRPKSLRNRIANSPVDKISRRYYRLLGDTALEYDNGIRLGTELPVDVALAAQYSIDEEGKIILHDADLSLSNKKLTPGEIASLGHVQLTRSVIAAVANTGGRNSNLGSREIDGMAANTHAMLLTAEGSYLDVIPGGFIRLSEMLERPDPSIVRELDNLTNAYAGL